MSRRPTSTLGQLLAQQVNAATPDPLAYDSNDNRPICRGCGAGLPPRDGEGACKEWATCLKRWQHNDRVDAEFEEVEDDADELDNDF